MDVSTLPNDTDYEAILDELIRYDWLYYGDRPKVIHGPAEYTIDEHNWRAIDVTFACGRTTEDAYIPGIFSRIGMKRCDRCCDTMGYPRGVGSPKNDDECRRILGLSAEM